MRLEGSRIVVTGSSGFLGRHVVSGLRRNGAEVVGCNRHPGPGEVEVDVTDPFSVRKALGPEHPADAVVHCAALVGELGRPEDYQHVNVLGTEHMLAAAAAAGVKRFIHVSSISVMGFHTPKGADESLRAEPCGDPYMDSKILAEERAVDMNRSGRLAVTVVRPGDIWGEGSIPWVDRPLELMRTGKFMWVAAGVGHLAPVHVSDVVRGILLVLSKERAAGEVYILTDGSEDTSCRDYFEALARGGGIELKAASLPRGLAMALAGVVWAGAKAVRRAPPFSPASIRYVTRTGSISCAKARRELGYAPAVDLEAGMAELGGSSTRDL